VELQRDAGGSPPLRTYAPTFISSTELDVVINGLHISAADDYFIWVVNPSPPAASAPRRSNPLTLVVQ
jgi:hypothetical protein